MTNGELYVSWSILRVFCDSNLIDRIWYAMLWRTVMTSDVIDVFQDVPVTWNTVDVNCCACDVLNLGIDVRKDGFYPVQLGEPTGKGFHL